MKHKSEQPHGRTKVATNKCAWINIAIINLQCGPPKVGHEVKTATVTKNSRIHYQFKTAEQMSSHYQ
jgi:hypothetical protein